MPGFYGFTAETQVVCKDEQGGSTVKFIKYLKQGDTVLSSDEEWHKVTRVGYINLTKQELVDLSFDYSKLDFVQLSANTPVLVIDKDTLETSYKMIAEVCSNTKKYMVGLPLKQATYDHVIKSCFETEQREVAHVYEDMTPNVSKMVWSSIDSMDKTKYTGQLYNIEVEDTNNFCVASLGIVQGLQL